MLQNFINGQLIAQQLHLQFQLDHCIQFITLTVHYTYQFVFLGRDFSNWQLIQVFQNAQLSLTHTHTQVHMYTQTYTHVLARHQQLSSMQTCQKSQNITILYKEFIISLLESATYQQLIFINPYYSSFTVSPFIYAFINSSFSMMKYI